MKQSSISYLKFDDRSSCIIVSLPQRNDTQVIYIDQIMGTLLFYGIKGYDVFDDKESAYKFVSKKRKLVQCVDAHSILGYVFSANCCHLILIEKEKPLFPLFDKHMIYSIENVIFIDIPIEIRCPKSNIINIDSLKKYPFNCSHYFCPTLDLSKDFGSLTNTIRTCWNQKLIDPFKRFLSLIPNLCVSVFQGIASYTPFVEINIGILFMSSRLFPPLFTKPGKHHSTELGVTCNEYNIDLYLIKNIGNDFEVLNHTIQIGDFPFNWSSDQNSTKLSIDSPEEIKKLTKAFIQRQKSLFNYDHITFVNFMSKVGIENDLCDTLNRSLNQLNYSTKELNSLNYEQDEVEWIQSMKETALLDDLVQNYWPTASSKIKKYGFTRSLITNMSNMQANVNESSNENMPYDCHVRARQKGICRFLYDFSFDREIIGLFFYIMKLLEIMCLDEFDLNFPEKLVIPLQVNTFLNGFVYFTAKFLLEFNLYLSNFGNLPIGDLEKLIYEYMKPPTVDIVPYQINYQNFLEAAAFLKNISVPSIFAVTQGPSSFVMTKNIGNQILRPFNSLVEIKNEQPLVICLTEPCYVKHIILRNTTAIQVSISGGLRLNRMIKIASKINLPWVPKTEQKITDPYIFIDLESQSSIYDNEYRPHDYEKIRFLVLKFKTFMKDPLKMNSLFVFGSSKGPNLASKKFSLTNMQLQSSKSKGLSEPALNPVSKVPKDFSDSNLSVQSSHTENVFTQKPKNLPDTQNSMPSENSQSHQNQPKSQSPTSSQNNQKDKKGPKQPSNKTALQQNNQQQSTTDGKSRIDKIIQSERNRLQKKEDYFEFQKILISKNISLDSYDLEKIINPNKPDKEPRKTACAKCQSKDMCTDCASCKRPFCKKCMKTIMIEMKEVVFCEECLNKRHQYLLAIEKLKVLQYESIKDQYPFIARHNDQLNNTENKPSMYLNFNLPSSISPISDFSFFGDINRPLISTFAFEPPIPQKIMTRLPECLFTSNVNWQFESTLAPLTIIFTAKCKVMALHIACFSRLEVEIERAKPNHLIFEPPGCIQKVELIGNYANLILSGTKIELRNIRFFGVPIIQKAERRNTGSQNLSPSKPRSLAKVSSQSYQFSKEMNMHEYIFNSPYNFLAIKFSKIKLMPPEIIAEFKTEKSVEYHNITLAKIIQNSSDSPIGIVLFPKPFNASRVRIFYPRLPQHLSASYASEAPDLMVLQKAKPQK